MVATRTARTPSHYSRAIAVMRRAMATWLSVAVRTPGTLCMRFRLLNGWLVGLLQH